MGLLPSYYDWIVSKFLDHISGTVVELGAGAGYQVAHYKTRAIRVIAVDHNPTLLTWLKASHPEERVTTRELNLLDNWDELEQGVADTVLALDVLEHFDNDRLFLSKAAALLKPGGYLCLKVPAHSRLFSSIDVASGHYRRYDPEPLSQLLAEEGFTVRKQEYMNPVGAIVYRFKKNHQKTFSGTFPRSILKTTNFIIPFLKPLDRIQRFGGLSLIGIYKYHG